MAVAASTRMGMTISAVAVLLISCPTMAVNANRPASNTRGPASPTRCASCSAMSFAATVYQLWLTISRTAHCSSYRRKEADKIKRILQGGRRGLLLQDNHLVCGLPDGTPDRWLPALGLEQHRSSVSTRSCPADALRQPDPWEPFIDYCIDCSLLGPMAQFEPHETGGGGRDDVHLGFADVDAGEASRPP